MSRDKLSHVNADSVKAALDGFALNIVGGGDHEVLAADVREALAVTILPQTLDPLRLSNANIRKKLSRLSRLARDLDNEISNLDLHSDQNLIDTSVKRDGYVNYIGFILSDESEYRKFHKASGQLSLLADFLQSAVCNTDRQTTKWRASEQRQIRVWRGQALIPVFESAFGKKVTVNGFPYDARHRAPTQFMIFYQRIMKLAFSLEVANDMPRDLKEARKIHRTK